MLPQPPIPNLTIPTPLLTSFTAISLVFNLEVYILLAILFSRPSLFFYAILLTNISFSYLSIQAVLMIYRQNYAYKLIIAGSITLTICTWSHYFILYSRLKLLHTTPKVIKFILWAILFHSLLIHPFCEIISIISWYIHSTRINIILKVATRLDRFIYLFVDLSIAFTYLNQVRKLFMDYEVNKKAKRIIKKLLAVTIFIIISDIIVFVFVFIFSSYDMFTLGVSFTPFFFEREREFMRILLMSDLVLDYGFEIKV